jgi:hypothetical protein
MAMGFNWPCKWSFNRWRIQRLSGRPANMEDLVARIPKQDSLLFLDAL